MELNEKEHTSRLETEEQIVPQESHPTHRIPLGIRRRSPKIYLLILIMLLGVFVIVVRNVDHRESRIISSDEGPHITAIPSDESNCREILPQETDIRITKALEPHYICAPDPNNRKGQLWIFFHGTGGLPSEYSLLAQEAADVGLHAINLRYEDGSSVNIKVCPFDTDPNCHENIRNEVQYGEDTSPHVEVNPVGSMDNRIKAILHYLEATYPEENWEQFISSENEVIWSKVMLGGHSQGGGHATFRSKRDAVARVVIFTWVDVRKGDLAPWIRKVGKTPSDRYYIFWHTDDKAIAKFIPKLTSSLGIDQYGEEVNIDSSQPPYNYSHILSTEASLPVNRGTRPDRFLPHNTVAVDDTLPLLQNGDPLWKGVWQYLLGETTSVSIKQSTAGKSERLGDPSVSYIDPEFSSSLHKVSFVDGNRTVWLSDLNAKTGDFVAVDGKEIRINDKVTPLGTSFNGPEFVYNANSWSLVYTKEIDSVSQPWNAIVRDGKVQNTPLADDGVVRLSALGTRNTNSENTYLIYAIDSWFDGTFAWANADSVTETEEVIDLLDRGVRWIDGTSSFIYVHQTGLHQNELEIVDAETGESKLITNDGLAKSFAYGWMAPEYDSLLVLAVVDESEIVIYKDNGGAYFEKIDRLTIPGTSKYSIVGSPEPFTVSNTSYISLVLKDGSGYAPAEAWVWGITSGTEKYAIQCDDGMGEVIRTDPETYIGENEVYLYYNLINDTRLRPGSMFELFKCRTGISV